MKRRNFLVKVAQSVAAAIAVKLSEVFDGTSQETGIDIIPHKRSYDFPHQEVIYRSQHESITIYGLVRNVNTAQWDAGTVLWTGIPVDWIDIPPNSSCITIRGVVVESHEALGSIFVFPHKV